MSHPSGVRPQIGFIGLGRMGTPIARNLLRAGFSLTVHNRSRLPVEALVRDGAVSATAPSEVARRVDILFTCLPGPADVEEVYLGTGGIVDGAHAGQVLCDMSTIGPATHRHVAGRVRQMGAAYVDAPVSGGVAGAQDGTLTIMVGASDEDFQRIQPVLATIGRDIHHVGPVGAGAGVKLINQMMSAATAAAAVEGLILVQDLGIDLEVAHAVLRSSSCASRALDRVAACAIKGEFGTGFPIDLMLKDVSLALTMAEELAANVPAGRLAAALLDEARIAGLGALGVPAMLLLHDLHKAQRDSFVPKVD